MKKVFNFIKKAHNYMVFIEKERMKAMIHCGSSFN
jgi:hypothetical protein